jgi:3-(3-hydroxy-phenyl)propionate hydroxylase
VKEDSLVRAPDYDVVIIGYGPVGAVFANLLGCAGCSTLVVDRMADIYDKPRAINIDHEVMRALQSVGLADLVNAITIPYAGTDFIGLDGGPIKVFEPSPPPYPLHWAPNLLFVQPEFERILRGGVDRFANVEVRLENEASSVWHDPHVAGLRLLASHGGALEVTARYVVACDGAASSIRKQLGIGQESLNFDEWWTVVDAWLKRPTPLPKRTTQFCWPSGPTTYVVGPRNLRRWELKLMPGETPEDYDDLNSVRRRLAPFVDTEAIELWRIATYRFHALVAREWRRGRIFLAGDAAHQTPPFMAQGLCSGIRDVANLAWKLTGVLRGQFPESILSSYETERKPHIRELVAVTKQLGEIIGELDVEAARRRDCELEDTLKSGQTVTLRQNLIPDLAAGIVAKDSSGRAAPGAGGLFPQPRVRMPDGRSMLLDDLIGDRFALILKGREASAWLNGEVAEALRQLGGVAFMLAAAGSGDETAHGIETIADQVGTLDGWMSANSCVAVLARPDKYVFGVANSRHSLARLCRSVRAMVFENDEAHAETFVSNASSARPPEASGP